jgi:hypothetical protein
MTLPSISIVRTIMARRGSRQILEPPSPVECAGLLVDRLCDDSEISDLLGDA